MLLFVTEAPSQTISPEPDIDYNREVFGKWADLDGDCQDTRHEILIRDAIEYTLTASSCRVSFGIWRDYYSGKELYDPKTIDIDHLVPAKELWDSGGYLFDLEYLIAMYNDPDNLVVTSRSINRGKGSHEPHEWRNYNKVVDKCDYLKRWYSFKIKYYLNFDEAEYAFLENSGCFY
jgi:hypothetical protein